MATTEYLTYRGVVRITQKGDLNSVDPTLLGIDRFTDKTLGHQR